MLLTHGFFIGIAIFTMVFGAGNIVFPLVVGNCAGQSAVFAFGGILLSSIVLPMLGFLACLDSGGNYRAWLQSLLGKHLAFLVTLVAMLILGPLGCMPRCATMAHAALAWNFFPGMSLFWFNLFLFALAFVLILSKSWFIDIFGKILGPINLLLIIIFIIKGFLTQGIAPDSGMPPLQAFGFGFLETYKTYDLLATIFYAAAIVTAVQVYAHKNRLAETGHAVLELSRRGAIIAAGTFLFIYSSFCFIAAKHAAMIPAGAAKADLINAYASALFGPQLGMIAGIVVFIACLNSACALGAVFADFTHNLTRRFGISYTTNAFFCCFVGFVLANLGFCGIERLLNPLTQFIYPLLIGLTLLTIFRKTKKLLCC